MSKSYTTPEYDFPADLRDLQTRLHQARAEHEALCRTLPWPVEPMPGCWAPKINENSKEVIAPGREPSPGYKPEQLSEDTRLRALVTDLSAQITTHPFWATLERGPELVAARMALLSHAGVTAAA
ncbi:hypothetical protein ACFVZH_40185 [Streptomyces sp. NPDC059534]|uniref:hypothetical protein n=1 Tax=Streptomyces sp. NPDC059534 TaxID=3346859 RepID=UPI0036C95CAA